MKRLEDLLHSALEPAGKVSLAATAISSIEPLRNEEREPICRYCGGARFVRKQVPYDHPDFGRALPCVCVRQEGEEERLVRLRRYSNLGALGRYTFESIIVRGRSPNPVWQERYQQAVLLARAFAEQPEGWLVLTGESGCGKTHIAAALANAAIARSTPALFMVVPDLLDHLRAAYAPTSEVSYDRLFDQVRSAPLLVLDDLGSQSPTPWAQEKLFQIINHRFNLQLPTVFTLAAPLESLEERLRSRLADAGFTCLCSLASDAYEESDLPDLLLLPLVKDMTFANFHYHATGPDLPDAIARKLKHAYDTARTYAEHPDGWLVLLGGTGCGKTHLAAAIAHQQREAGRSQMFVVVPDLLERLRADMHADRPRDRPEYIDRVRTCEFLVLDDLGVHSATQWAQEKLFQILNYRYNAKLATVITVGRPMEELPSPWVSRMFDDKVGMMWEIEAPDYRGLRNTQAGSNRRERRGR